MNDPAAALALPNRASAGLWSLASRRFRRDRVGTWSLAVVVVFVAISIAAGLGLVAHDWEKEVGVSYAPPTFMGSDAAAPAIEALKIESPATPEERTIDRSEERRVGKEGRARWSPDQ